MSARYSEFYPKTVHVMFAVVVATSFSPAADIMVPIDAALEPDHLVASIMLVLSFLVVILGWIGYARSALRWPYGDTRWGALRFGLDIFMLSGYFYLLQIAPTEHIGHFASTVFFLAVVYLASEAVKLRDSPHQQRALIRTRLKYAVSVNENVKQSR